MKIRAEIERLAIEVCKRHSHAVITELHVLRALHSKIGSEGSKVTTKMVDKALDKIPIARNSNLFVNENASKCLDLIDVEDPIKIRDALTEDIFFSPESTDNEGQADGQDPSRTNIDDLTPNEEIYKPAPKKVAPKKNESLDVVLAELNSLIGLKKAKEQVNAFIAVHSANVMRKKQNLPPVNMGLHLVFSGSPGTGKTTVARLIGRLYRAIGLLTNGDLVEVDRSDLIAGFVGQTAIKTQMKIAEADGGVLFIDEAYSLATDAGSDRGFGDEAIATLVKAMEDKRDSFAVVVAGYSQDMEKFIQSNKGLKSRFQTVIHFDDYTVDELVQIFKLIANKSQVQLPTEVEKALIEYIVLVKPSGDDGNGRFARNLFEKMFQKLTTRVLTSDSKDVADLNAFTVADIPDLSDTKNFQSGNKQPFGFA